MKTSIIFVLAVAILFLAASCAQKEPAPSNGNNGNLAKTNIVEITSSGFIPKALTINSGNTVVFANKDSSSHWPASAVHPTHQLYPGFDARHGLAENEEYSFKFDKKGSWKYHDHLNPSLTGTIVVQ